MVPRDISQILIQFDFHVFKFFAKNSDKVTLVPRGVDTKEFYPRKPNSKILNQFKINKNDNVLIIDDLIATGGTAEAAARLIEISNAKVASFIFVINLFDLGGSDSLIKNNYKVENLIDFPGH